MNGIWVPITMFIVGGVTAIGLPIARAIGRKIDREAGRGPAIPPDVQARLERMEQAIDSIAVEVERIAEGQRFTTKLLSERAGERAGDAALPAAAAKPEAVA